mgnify:CR=1 FL=1|jgi:hypothetical protein
MLFNLKQIREAVDITIGDDGFRSKEVVEILKLMKKEESMQSKEVMDRLNNPPVIDGRDKPIDLNDMPNDMDEELVKVAIHGIVESVLTSYQDKDIHKKSVRHNIANEVFKLIINEQFGLKLGNVLKRIEGKKDVK